MAGTVDGPVAVVTGAGRGLGRAICERLAADGLHVVATDIDGEAARATASATKGVGTAMDVTDPASVAAVAAELDRCDVLVNNAGIWRFTPLQATPPEDVCAVLEVNVLGLLTCVQAFTPLMAGGGSIVNLTSITAESVTPGVGIYPASKAAVIALTKQIALEYAGQGIRCNAVGPGMIPTEGTLATYGHDEADQARRGAPLPLGRMGTPAEIADAVAFFASDASRYVTGQVLFVDGGLTAATAVFLSKAR